MESLYALSVNGSMLYICGNLSDIECAKAEAIAEHIHCTNKEDAESICRVASKTLCILRSSDSIKWFSGARGILALYRYRNTVAMGSQGL